MTDSAKLEALRKKYAAAAGGDIFDAAFAAVARAQFKGSDCRNGLLPAFLRFWTRHAVPMRRTCRISAVSISRSSAFQWTLG
jgi:hypothetical protein